MRVKNKKKRLRLGKRKIRKLEGWVSAFVQPSGKFWKRVASKQHVNAKTFQMAQHISKHSVHLSGHESVDYWGQTR